MGGHGGDDGEHGDGHKSIETVHRGPPALDPNLGSPYRLRQHEFSERAALTAAAAIA
jgi:hypothetical protein